MQHRHVLVLVVCRHRCVVQVAVIAANGDLQAVGAVHHVVVGHHVILRDHHAAAAGVFHFALLAVVSVAVAVAAVAVSAVTVAVPVSVEIPEEVAPGIGAVAVAAVAVGIGADQLVVINAHHAVPHIGNGFRERGGQHHFFRFRAGRGMSRPKHCTGHNAYKRQSDHAQSFLVHYLSHVSKPPFGFRCYCKGAFCPECERKMNNSSPGPPAYTSGLNMNSPAQ